MSGFNFRCSSSSSFSSSFRSSTPAFSFASSSATANTKATTSPSFASAAASTPSSPFSFNPSSSSSSSPSLFGAASSTSSPSSYTLFGSVSSSGFGAVSSSPFGVVSSSSTLSSTLSHPLFGTPTPATSSASAPALSSPFGSNTPSVFRTPPSSSPFRATTSLFGTPSTQTQSSYTSVTTPATAPASAPSFSNPFSSSTPPAAATGTAPSATPSTSSFSFSTATTASSTTQPLFGFTNAPSNTTKTTTTVTTATSPLFSTITTTTASTPASVSASSAASFGFPAFGSASSTAATVSSSSAAASSFTGFASTTVPLGAAGGGSFTGFSLSTKTTAPAALSHPQSTAAAPPVFGTSAPTSAAKTASSASAATMQTLSLSVASSSGTTSSVSTTSTVSTTVSAAPKLPSEIIGKTVEEIIKKWNAELQERTGKFRKQAAAIAEWDERILQDHDVLLKLEIQIEVAKVVETEANLEQQLELIETHQQEGKRAMVEGLKEKVEDPLLAQALAISKLEQRGVKTRCPGKSFAPILDASESEMVAGAGQAEVSSVVEETPREEPKTEMVKVLNTDEGDAAETHLCEAADAQDDVASTAAQDESDQGEPESIFREAVQIATSLLETSLTEPPPSLDTNAAPVTADVCLPSSPTATISDSPPTIIPTTVSSPLLPSIEVPSYPIMPEAMPIPTLAPTVLVGGSSIPDSSTPTGRPEVGLRRTLSSSFDGGYVIPLGRAPIPLPFTASGGPFSTLCSSLTAAFAARVREMLSSKTDVKHFMTHFMDQSTWRLILDLKLRAEIPHNILLQLNLLSNCWQRANLICGQEFRTGFPDELRAHTVPVRISKQDRKEECQQRLTLAEKKVVSLRQQQEEAEQEVLLAEEELHTLEREDEEAKHAEHLTSLHNVSFYTMCMCTCALEGLLEWCEKSSGIV